MRAAGIDGGGDARRIIDDKNRPARRAQRLDLRRLRDLRVFARARISILQNPRAADKGFFALIAQARKRGFVFADGRGDGV